VAPAALVLRGGAAGRQNRIDQSARVRVEDDHLGANHAKEIGHFLKAVHAGKFGRQRDAFRQECLALPVNFGGGRRATGTNLGAQGRIVQKHRKASAIGVGDQQPQGFVGFHGQTRGHS
jgi:hypothetical protein